MGGRTHQVFFDPEILFFVFEKHATFGDGAGQSCEGSLGRLQVFNFSRVSMSAQKQRNTLSLGQSGIPGRFQGVAVVPVEMVVPDPEAERILLQIIAKPSGSLQRLLAAGLVTGGAELIVVRQAPLSDSDWVVLEADHSSIVEHGNAVGVVGAGVIGLFAKQHIVLAKLAAGTSEGARRSIVLKCPWIEGRGFVPECEVASPGAEIGAEDAPVILPTRGHAHSGYSISQIVVV